MSERATPLARTRDILLFEGGSAVRYWRRFAALLAISVVIATAGLYRNSSAVVIAAMLIAPLMTPILGIAGALVMGWVRRTALLLAFVGIAAVGTVALAFLMMFVSDAPRGMRVASEVVARTDPGIEELLVALSAGIAGAYVQIHRREISLLPGAAIGVSLVPPLAAAGILLYFRQGDEAVEAALLFLTNLAAIVLSACVVYIAMGMRPIWRRRGHAARFGFGIVATLCVVGALAAQLGTATVTRFREARLEERALEEVEAWSRGHTVEIARIDISHGGLRPGLDLWLILDVPLEEAGRLVAPAVLVPDDLTLGDLRGRLRDALGPAYEVALRVQLRFAGLVDLSTGRQSEAPPAENTPDDGD